MSWMGLVMVAALAAEAPAQSKKKGGGDSTPANPAIAYRVVSSRGTDLMVMDADGTHATVVLSRLASIGAPAMSADGTEIAFGGTVNGVSGVHAVRVDGGGLRLVSRIYYSGANLVRPAWSPVAAPDGRVKIAFTDTADAASSGQLDVWLVNADGTGRQRLTDTPLRGESFPAWSADATRLAVRTYPDLIVLELGVAGGQVTVTGESNVTGIAGSPLEGAATLGIPAWANTRSVLVLPAITADSGSAFDLWRIDLAAPHLPLRITRTSTDEDWPSFSPDDAKLVVQAGSSSIQHMNADGSGAAVLRSGRSPNAKRR